jgi:hypothetical protein
MSDKRQKTGSSKRGFFMYVRIVCPYCRFETTAPESLGIHLVEKHPDKVIKGHKIVKVKEAKQ